MKNSNNSVNFVLGAAFLVVAFATFMGAFPGTALATYGNGYSYGYDAYTYAAYPYDSYCAYPQTAYVAANGYYTCRYPSAQPVYQSAPAPAPIYNPLSVACYANNYSVSPGQGVTWTATASGGYGSYTYMWSGTDGLTGYGQSAFMNYWNPGYKTATVTVYSGGQQVFVNCSNSVNVFQPVVYQPQPVYQPQQIYQGPTIIHTNISGLDVGCYAEPITARINQPVTWNVEVVGGVGPYRYAWVGSDGLESEAQTAVQFYKTAGYKSALVTVYSADGRQATKACSNSVKVISNTTVAKKPVAKPVTTCTPCTVEPATGKEGDNSAYVPPQTGGVVLSPNGLTNTNGAAAADAAGAFFSLNNVPWGWVAVIVIIILFIACMYLVFNKPKI